LRAQVAAGGGVVAVVGHPGVGKTVLAVWAAHELASDFPDGCFAVDLRGMDDQPVSPRAALDRLLRALGVAGPQIPPGESEQSSLLRLLVRGRRVLVLLDNAANEAQVRPLVVTSPGCLTLITCRGALAGLEGVRWMWLDPLTEPDAVALLGSIAGRERVAAEPRAAAELAGLCGNLPLAVRILGNRLASRPHWTLAYLLSQVRDERTRLSALAAGDLQVRSAFEMSYRRLSPPARRVFRRLAAIPGTDFGPELAAIATGATLPDTQAHLDELADAGLLQPAPTPGRFQFHDLIRLFAAERHHTEDTPADQARYTHAVLDHLLDTATTAGHLFYPDTPDNPETGPFTTRDDAAHWLDQESSNWSAAQRDAARLGRHRDVLDLATAMHWYSDSHWFQVSWEEVFTRGVAAARVLGSRGEEAKLLNFLGWVQYFVLEDNETGLVTHREALAVAVEAGDRQEQAWAHGYLSTVLMRLDRPGQALGYAEQACELAGEFGFWTMRVSLRNRLGRVLRALGRYDEALAVHRDLLAEMDRRRGEVTPRTWQMMVAAVGRDAGHCLSGLRQWRQAADMFREARLAYADNDVREVEAETALFEGIAWREAGEYTRARECLHNALAAFNTPLAESRRQRVLAELELLPKT